MNKSIIGGFFIALLGLAAISCAGAPTALGPATGRQPVTREGSVTKYRVFGKSADLMSIVLRGDTEQSGQGNWTLLGVKTAGYEWHGSFYSSGTRCPLTVSCVADNGPFPNMSSVKIRDMPDEWVFDEFEVPNTGGFADGELPARLASFTLRGNRYTVTVDAAVKREGSKTVRSLYTLVTARGAVFRITEETGLVCAEFNRDSFRIFGSAVDPDLMQQAVAVYSVAHRMFADVRAAVNAE